MTPLAIKKLKAELSRLKTKKMPEAADEVRRTGMFGDFSENAEYQYAKGQLRRILDRMTMLEHQLNNAVPISTKNTGVVSLGSSVVVESMDKRKTYKIVGSAETNPGQGRISHHSPLGQLLLGKKVGDIVTLVTTNNRQTIYKIVQIK